MGNCYNIYIKIVSMKSKKFLICEWEDNKYVQELVVLFLEAKEEDQTMNDRHQLDTLLTHYLSSTSFRPADVLYFIKKLELITLRPHAV